MSAGEEVPPPHTTTKTIKRYGVFCNYQNEVTSIFFTSKTAPQDAHTRLVMQVANWLTASLYQCSREVSDMS